MSDAFSPLLFYVNYIVSGNIMNLRPPANGISVGTAGLAIQDGILLGVCLDRQGQYQTELFVVHPTITVINNHTHPDVDSYELHVSGTFDFINNGEHNLLCSDGTPIGHRLQSLVKVDCDTPHGGVFNGEGGAFLSFQHWRNNITPTSVAYNFIDLNKENK